MSEVPTYLRRAVTSDTAEPGMWRDELLLALIDTIEWQTQVHERVALASEQLADSLRVIAERGP